MAPKHWQKKETKDDLVSKILSAINAPYTEESAVFQRAEKGLKKLSMEALDALRTLTYTSRPRQGRQ